MAASPLPDDDQLIPRLLAGDQAAYALVVRAYHGLMVHLARSIAGEAIADEIAQDAWLSVMKNLPRFERRSSLKTWILSIVGNSAKSRLRHESRNISLEALTDGDGPLVDPARFQQNGHWEHPPAAWSVDTPEALLASRQLNDCIQAALTQLPPIQSAIIALRDMQGMDMENICKILDLTESNARVLLHRARGRIQAAIDRFHEK